MKKLVLSLTLVLAFAMMSLTAFAASEVSASTNSAKQGDTVTFTVSLSQADSCLDADVVVNGLEVVDVKDGLGLSEAGRVQMISGFDVVYTCRVTSDTGTATFTLTNIKRGANGADATATGEADDVTTVTIEGATEPSEDPTEPSEDPTQPTNPAEPTNPSTPNGGNNGSGSNNSQSGTGTVNGNLDKAPNTGDATASVWPLVLIGCMGVAAAIVAGKKLAYRR